MGPVRAERLENLPRAALNGNGSVGRGELIVGGNSLDIRQTTDFPLDDGWSRLKRNVIARRRVRGDFRGKDGTEAGVGDARNLFVAGVHLEPRGSEATVTGVDLDPWRAAVAAENLRERVADNRLTILVGDAIGDLQARPEGDLVKGWHLACLPQAPGFETVNHADGIDPTLTTLNATRDLNLGPESVDTYGLSLNAAYLRALRDRASQDTDVQVTISGRVPAAVRARLFTETGWEVKEVFGRQVNQDVDTGTSYVNKYAEELNAAAGDGFFEQKGGIYAPISPAEAEERRQAHAAGENGQILNVHHKVFEYVAVPANGQKRTEPVAVYEI